MLEFLIIANIVLAQIGEKPETTFFVSIDGNDAWSGMLAEPNTSKTDGPFATLSKARDAIHNLKVNDNLKNPVTVMVRGGKYFLDEHFILTKRIAEHKIVLSHISHTREKNQY